MDASDVIRKRLQSAEYSLFIQNLQKTQPACTSTSCYSTLTTCVRNFTSYEQRFNVLNGMATCVGCSTVCGFPATT
jgi:hypothetical protein